MKKTFGAALLVTVTSVVLIASCKKEKQSDTGNEDVLIEANNSKALGKYSGLIFGSVGSYILELRTVGSKATLVFDGATHVLDGQGVIEDNTAVNNYVFQKGDIKINFSVSADGKTPSVQVGIPGHNVRATISKETTIYETVSYAGKIRDSLKSKDLDPAGITISNNTIRGFAKIDTQYVTISGQRVDTSSNLRLSFSNQPGKTYPANINGNMISGGTDYVFRLSKVN